MTGYTRLVSPLVFVSTCATHFVVNEEIGLVRHCDEQSCFGWMVSFAISAVGRDASSTVLEGFQS
jgi:hypothetical protein